MMTKIIDAIIGAIFGKFLTWLHQLWLRNQKSAEDQSDNQAKADKLKESVTPEEQRDATRDIANKLRGN